LGATSGQLTRASHLLHVRGADQSWPPKPPQSGALLFVEDDAAEARGGYRPLTLLARADDCKVEGLQ
jgi:hypothetical protein